MNDLVFPDFAELLAPCIAQISADAFPRFLAALERGAGERYRQWAKEIPEHVEVLMACAVREDKIAAIVESSWPLADDAVEQFRTPLSQARELYSTIFVGLSPWEQLEIQANAELQGAAAWRGVAVNVTDPTLAASLERCAVLEEESARELHRIITRRMPRAT
jgi:hypothetical protein